MFHLKKSPLVCLLFLLVTIRATAPRARAQQVGGTIAGDVVDPSNATVAQANVLIHNDETGGERHLVTAADGTFSAPSIPVGAYTVSVTRDGFAPLNRTGIAYRGRSGTGGHCGGHTGERGYINPAGAGSGE